MEAFPAFLPLTGRTVILAGSGPGADARARLLAGTPASVVRLDGPAACEAEAYEDAVLAFVASGDADFRRQAADAARAAHVPVNVMDDPALSDFYTPAIVDRGEVVVAIGTAGASPMLAAMLRGDIETMVPEGAGRVAALLREHREKIVASLPEMHERRALLRDALSGPPAVAALVGDMEEAGRLLLESLERGPQALGAVRFIAGRGPVDLLTLRAARAISAADIVVADEDADPQIVALARRDAERLAPAEATAERLAELAGGGRKVARIIAHAAEPALLKALKAANVRVDVLLAAPGA
jgi:precorrin-2 dehydrogenase/sirohydrochlorin ferrochelatase